MRPATLDSVTFLIVLPDPLIVQLARRRAAAVWMAWFNVRFPRRERRWRILPPEETSMGAVPLHAAYLSAESNLSMGACSR